MPSHIFTRVGEWEASAATNLRSSDAAVKGSEADEAYHAADYSVYAFLQLARDAEARRIMDQTLKIPGIDQARFTAFYAAAAMPARLAVERSAWTEAAQLQTPSSKFLFTNAITHFARALGAARSGNAAAAEQEAEQLATIHKALLAAKNNYWATEVEVQRLAAAGWIALARSNTEDALKFMRAAADMEDKSEKHIVTPGRILPARELLGDMLLELKQPAAALKEYEMSQEREPNRYRGYAGAAKAAEQSGQRSKAAEHYRKLLALAKNADSARPEIAHAKTYVAER